MKFSQLFPALLFICAGLLPLSSWAGVLPPSFDRTKSTLLKRFQEKRERLRQEAEDVRSGKNHNAQDDRELAIYMIDQLKRKMPKTGAGRADTRSVVRNWDLDSLYYFCIFYPQYCASLGFQPTCADDEFRCSDDTCIPNHWKCDNIRDCQNDEDNCQDHVCPSGQFQCDSGHCIPGYFYCDNYPDCADGSDESNCGTSVTTAPSTTSTTTPSTEAPCGWGDWSAWSDCNSGCGAGMRQRDRACLCSDVTRCQGDSTEYMMCELETCMPEAADGCGTRRPSGPSLRIVGGNDAAEGAWPWYAQLRVFGGFTCGGTLVEGRFIVTAAHCLEGSDRMNPSNWQVVLGKRIGGGRYDNEHWSGVSSIVVHENYDGDTVDNDIAILVLSSPPDLSAPNDYINSVCLDTVAEPDTTSVCYIVGFGNTREDGSLASVLQEAEVPIVPRAECNGPTSYGGSLTQNMICAGFREGGVDSCQGDSGGPLVCSRQSTDDQGNIVDRWYLTGVTSWGNGCARENFPGVYAKVANYQQWIQNIIDRN